MIDAHLHIQDIPAEGRRAFIERAAARGVTGFFCNATGPRDWAEVRAVAEQFLQVVPFYGVHPWWADGLPSDWDAQLEEIVARHRSGIGEIGLDRKHPGGHWPRQIEIFERQLRLAGMAGRLISIHCVGCWPDMMKYIRRRSASEVPCIVHSFIADTRAAQAVIDMGGYLSVSPRSLGHPGTRQVIQSLSDAPFVIESDFSAHQVEGYVGDSLGDFYADHLEACYRRVADLKGIDLAELIRQVQERFVCLQGFLGP